MRAVTGATDGTKQLKHGSSAPGTSRISHAAQATVEQAAGSAESNLPVAGLTPWCPLLSQHLFELASLDLVTDHFFLAGQLGPGHFQTRSWSFRSKNRLAFIKKQSTPVLLVATRGWACRGRAHRQPQPLRRPHSRLPGGVATPGTSPFCPSTDAIQRTPFQPSCDSHLRIPLASCSLQALPGHRQVCRSLRVLKEPGFGGRKTERQARKYLSLLRGIQEVTLSLWPWFLSTKGQ